MEVGHGQELGLSGGEPLRPRQPLALRAVAIAARVVRDAGRAAIVACLDMAAERRRSASRDGAHDPPLRAAEVTFVSTAIGLTVAANDVRHLQACGHVIRSGGRHDLQRQPIERALRASDKLVRDPRVARRARQIPAAPE